MGIVPRMARPPSTKRKRVVVLGGDVRCWSPACPGCGASAWRAFPRIAILKKEHRIVYECECGAGYLDTDAQAGRDEYALAT